MENTSSHTCPRMREYADEHNDKLNFINFPPYSPDINAQENLWNLLKNSLFQTRARASIKELLDDICNIYQT